MNNVALPSILAKPQDSTAMLQQISTVSESTDAKAMSPNNQQLTTAIRLIMKMNERGFRLIQTYEDVIKGSRDCYYTLRFTNDLVSVNFCIDTSGYPESNDSKFDDV
jgi:hypothetical protein